MSRLGTTLTTLDLPHAELCAMRIDGELFTVDEWFCPVDSPDSPTQRASALGVICEHRFIVEQNSAAWVWGALVSAPARHELCSSIGARARSSYPLRVHTREVVIDERDWVQLGDVRVTTPLRTLLDLVRCADHWDESVARALLAIAGRSLEHCRDLVMTRRNLPGKKLALARLDGLATAPATVRSASPS